MWGYSFMLYALLAGIIIATICGIMSVFVVLRRSAFAAHALGHMSLTGTALALLCGLPALSGQLGLNLICAVIIGLIGDRISRNDLAVGVVLTFILGLGAYFLFLFQNNYAGSVMNILFGDILSVSLKQIYALLSLALIIIVMLIILQRPLVFASIDPVLAQSKNVPVRCLGILFFILLALTVSMACQAVGALLVFSLLIIPGAIGIGLSDGIYKNIILSVVIANIAVIASLYISFYFNLPTSFCITTILSVMYAIVEVWRNLRIR